MNACPQESIDPIDTTVSSPPEASPAFRPYQVVDPWTLYGRVVLGAACGIAILPVVIASGAAITSYVLMISHGLDGSWAEKFVHAPNAFVPLAAFGFGLFLLGSLLGYVLAVAMHVAGKALFEGETPVWYAALAGGWIAIVLVGAPAILLEPEFAKAWGIATLAVVSAQSLAVGNLRRALREGSLHIAPDLPQLDLPRFRIRQLLGLTALVALLSALASLLPRGGQLVGFLLWSVVLQFSMIIAWLYWDGRRTHGELCDQPACDSLGSQG